MRQACVAVLEEEWHHVPGARDLAEHLWHRPGHRQAHAGMTHAGRECAGSL